MSYQSHGTRSASGIRILRVNHLASGSFYRSERQLDLVPAQLADKYYNLIIGAMSSQAGLLSFYTFIDDAGTVEVAADQTVALTANTAAILKIRCDSARYTPVASFTIQVTNSGGSTATLSDVAVLESA
jgi:hypothetical protein